MSHHKLPPLRFPALYASHAGIWIADLFGHCRPIGHSEAVDSLVATPHILLNAPLTGERLGYNGELSGLDLLELYAFLYPTRLTVPTAAGLARSLRLEPPSYEAEIAPALLRIAAFMMAHVQSVDWREKEGAWHSVQSLARHRWIWAPMLIARMEPPLKTERWFFSRLPEWEESPPRGRAASASLEKERVAQRLSALTGEGSELRHGQIRYAQAAAQIFEPREKEDCPQFLLAEAGTGIGKTLGYLSPASLWISESSGVVGISTFTKALQRQLAREIGRLYRDEASRRKGVVVRKGRENYLCLLNLEDALQGGFSGRSAILAQLVARWARYSKDGDMVGGDLPGWLAPLFRRGAVAALSDQRGECIYAACPHYRKCFIERSIRAASQADIVISNHALTLVQAARTQQIVDQPTRLIFDEGHHLFDAADSVFAVALTGREGVELRRWIIGPEKHARGRRRGLAARLADVASYDSEGAQAIHSAVSAAAELPSSGWLARLTESKPCGALEHLFFACRAMVYARARENGRQDHGYSLEADLTKPDAALLAAAQASHVAITALRESLVLLYLRLEALIATAPDWLDGPARERIEGACFSLDYRCEMLSVWCDLLERIAGPIDSDFVDWLSIERFDGREFNCGIHRHWLDPTRPLAKTIYEPAHGVMVTSATLRAGGEWDDAKRRSGAQHLEGYTEQLSIDSPFDYETQSEVLIITDIKRGDIAALAGAYSRLIEASGGGVLGLFTAIRRLRNVYERSADRLARVGLTLYAQHVDPLDTGTLIDIFRDDPLASLLGTDALRDGIDIQGESLRLVIMEGVPWPRPTILHTARKRANNGNSYDDMIIRARFAQAFGRLIRSNRDRGQFIILSSALPSRFLSAFPAGTPILRLKLDEAIARVVQQGRAPRNLR